MKVWLAALMMLFAGVVAADEVSLLVCYNYGCVSESTVVYSAAQLDWVHLLLAGATSPQRERELLAQAVGRLYGWAGEQTPIWRDRGGNYADDGVDGKMDCIDHSTTTTRFLRMIEARGWLRFHRVLDPVRRVRFFLFQHYSALVEELPLRNDARQLDIDLVNEDFELPGEGERLGPRFVIDSWFVDNGKPAVVLPLDNWMSGGGPDD